ncbi:MAG: hypothetical protein E3J56_16095 [Candidatus Aminicenantes bacterium]|nr:MAG: hypothetical protein E3J56_16095 [Candidatus Aminicenantes bacterium]
MKLAKTPAILICIGLLVLSACAQQRPVLYPNYHLEQVGKEVAEAEIDECIRLATEHGAKSNSGSSIAKEGARSAAIGGVTGAAVGAIFGSAGRSAAAGAAGGGAAGVTRGAIDSDKPDPIFRQFVERCLREKGYEPIGWR